MKIENQNVPNECYLCGHAGSREVLSLKLPDWETSFRLLRCTSCGLEFLRPLPPANRMLNQYGEGYYRNGYLVHETDRRRQFRALLEELSQRGASGPLLDVGAGIGLLVSVAKQEGWQVAGIEPSMAACRLAQELYGIHLDCGQITEVVPRPEFGVVVLWQVVAHVSDPLDLLRRAAKMLRTDGLLVISSINWKDPHYGLAKLLTRWKKVNAIHLPTILWRFRKEHLQSLASQAGLRVESVEYGPRAFRESFGWKRRLAERGFEAYRRSTGTGEEIRLWCRPQDASRSTVEVDSLAESNTWNASTQAHLPHRVTTA
jgi:SAM-dependent methyltransferase